MSTPDARRTGPGIAWRERRTGPRHAAVWVRISGQWRKGRIIEWVTETGAPGWDCVILADEPPAACPGKAATPTTRRLSGAATVTPRPASPVNSAIRSSWAPSRIRPCRGPGTGSLAPV